MNKLYLKNELGFAIMWIVIYVALVSAADNLTEIIGIYKLPTAMVCIAISVLLFTWVKRNHLLKKYGLCRTNVSARKMLFYIPLVLLASVNLWHGTVLNYPPFETSLYIISMLFVGFLEEIIFRGLLFKAMCKDNVKSAIIVSSVTFGLGHIINLINGSGANLLSNLLQVVYAIAIGFLFTILFYSTKSILACIITHGIFNGLSVFANQSLITTTNEIASAVILSLIAIIYALYIIVTVKAADQ